MISMTERCRGNPTRRIAPGIAGRSLALPVCSMTLRGGLAQFAELLVDLLEVFEERLAAFAGLIESPESGGLLGDRESHLHERALGRPGDQGLQGRREQGVGLGSLD